MDAVVDSSGTSSPDEPPAPSGVVAARGAAVTFLGQGSRILLQIAALVVLARLLTPQDYGLVAMVTVVAGVAEIFRDFGLSAAAIQRQSLSDAQRSNLFWLNTASGAMLMLLSFVAAPAVAQFYGQPAVTEILRVLGVTFLINGLSTQYRAGLVRHLRFGSLAAIDVGSQLLGFLTGLALAIGGWGFWALVAMQVVQALTALVSLVVLGGWLPRLPQRNQGTRQFLGYGIHYVGSQLVRYGSNNVDSLVIGRRLGPDSLGYYDRAYKMVMLPYSQSVTPLTTVALPILSRHQAQPDQYSRLLIKSQVAMGYTIIPALALAAGLAAPLTALVLGPQWAQSAPVLAILAIGLCFETLPLVGYWVYLSRALTRQLFRFTLAASAAKVLLVLIGSNWGVLGVAVGVALAPAVTWPFSLWYLNRITDYPGLRLFRGGTRLVLLGLLAAALAHLAARAWPGGDVADLVIGSLCGLAVYFVAAVFPSVRRDELMVLGLAARAVRNRM